MTERKGATLTDVVCISANQMASRVGDEVAILDLDRSIYYGLDPIGARIWELMQTPIPLSSVLDVLVTEFDVDDATARSDLLELVDELLATQLVEVRPTRAG
jgi:hypothetical protein